MLQYAASERYVTRLLCTAANGPFHSRNPDSQPEAMQGSLPSLAESLHKQTLPCCLKVSAWLVCRRARLGCQRAGQNPGPGHEAANDAGSHERLCRLHQGPLAG